MGGERASCGSLERKAKPGSHPTQDGHSSTADSELPSLSLTLPTQLTPFSSIHSFPITLSTPDTGTRYHSKQDKGGVFRLKCHALAPALAGPCEGPAGTGGGGKQPAPDAALRRQGDLGTAEPEAKQETEETEETENAVETDETKGGRGLG